VIVVSGAELLGPGLRSFDSVLLELLDRAMDEVQIAAYLMDPWDELFTALRRTVDRGVSLRLVLNRMRQQDGRTVRFLCGLGSGGGRVSLHDFDLPNSILHAKVVVVDRRFALVGSANLGPGGLHRNYEMGALLEGGDAWRAAGVIDRLIGLSRTFQCGRLHDGSRP
jgi:cardiolipin synthase